MKCLRVAAGVLAQTPLDWRGNARRVLSALHAARDEGVSLLCLPELCLTGYGCEDTFASADLLRRAWELLEHVEAESRDLVVAVGLPIRYHNAVFNAAALLCDGSLLGLVAKRFLAGDGIHYEPRWFKPWEEGRRTLLRQGGREVPLGDLLFDLGGVRVGFEICEDAWVANRPGAVLARRGVDLLLNPSASHFAFGKRDIRRRFILEGSRALCCSYLYANLLGNEAGRAIYDGSALLASNGHVIAEGARFSFKDWGLCVGEVDIDATRTAAARSANSRPLLVEEGDVLRAEFAWPTRRPPLVAPALPAWELAGSLEYEEFTRAVALGLFDYLRKSRSRGFVLSLSGGADSSTVACLVHIAVRLALSELGVEGLRGRLSYLDDLPVTEDPRAWTRRLLLCAYQATAQSSHTTLDAARAVADAVGARFVLLDVEPIVAAYIARVAEALGRPLDWSHDDLALQNIQARARGPGVWMLANVEGALLLATSNRSEAAVGYATMDGDTCGGLAPLAGIHKDFIRGWLRWMEREGPRGLGPMPALAVVNAQAPTAELRPAGRGQTDEGDLMPYAILDVIERLAVEEKRAPDEILPMLGAQFPERDVAELAVHVRRFFQLWCRNQWKRERFAPSFHLDTHSLDPRTWCRFPILSGGFEEELVALDEERPRPGGDRSSP